MKVSCTQENIQRAVNVVGHIAGRNATLPILNNLLLKAEQGVLVLSGTNLEVGITHKIRAKVEEEGAYTVQARVFSEFITLLPKGQVDIVLQKNGLRVSAGKHTSTLKGISAEEFPVIPEINEKTHVKLSSDSLHQAIQQTAFAAASDESRPEISGALCVFENGALTIAATDSYRLAERTVPVQGGSASLRTILPTKTLMEVLRILPVEEGDAVLFLEENQFALRTGETELVSRVIEGQYPDYKQIIPEESTTRAVFDRQEFVNNVKAASLFCKPGINDLTIAVHPEEQRIAFSAENTQVGEQRSDIPAQITGSAVSLVFNYRYLLEGLGNFSSDEVELFANNEKNPGLFRPKGREDYLYLVMPIRQ